MFVPHITKHNIKRPVILFVDGHKTNLTVEASDACITNGIVLYCLLENASHLMQPCDLVAVRESEDQLQESSLQFSR